MPLQGSGSTNASASRPQSTPRSFTVFCTVLCSYSRIPHHTHSRQANASCCPWGARGRSVISLARAGFASAPGLHRRFNNYFYYFITRVRAGWPVRAASHVHLVVAELCCGTPCQLPAQRWELWRDPTPKLVKSFVNKVLKKYIFFRIKPGSSDDSLSFNLIAKLSCAFLFSKI